MARQNQYSPGCFLDRYADLRGSIQTGDLDDARDQLAELEPLQAWLALKHFDRRQVNQVVSRRVVKQQQMRWTPRGAHLLLQVRTQVLNEDLQETFDRWYPGMQTGVRQQEKAA